MIPIGNISDMKEIVRVSWSLFQHDNAAAFQLLERSTLPPALFAKNIPGGQNEIFNVHRIRTINCHQAAGDEESMHYIISDTKNGSNWNSDLYNPNGSEDDDVMESDSVIEQDNGIEDTECPEQQDASVTPNIPVFIRPTRKSKWQADQMLMMVNVIETRRNKGVKRTYDRMCQCLTSIM
jgi:hypothetical protein